MILNIYFEINGSLIEIKNINKLHEQRNDVDWYCFPGGIEIIDKQDRVILDRNVNVDTIPLFREFFLTIAGYYIMYENQNNNDLREKLCTSTTLYYGNIPKMTFSKYNDFFIEMNIYNSKSESYSLIEDKSVFYEKFLEISKIFILKVPIMFPNREIETIQLIENLIKKINNY